MSASNPQGLHKVRCFVVFNGRHITFLRTKIVAMDPKIHALRRWHSSSWPCYERKGNISAVQH